MRKEKGGGGQGSREAGGGGGGIYGKERTKCFLGDNTSVSALYSFLKKEKKQKKKKRKKKHKGRVTSTQPRGVLLLCFVDLLKKKKKRITKRLSR